MALAPGLTPNSPRSIPRRSSNGHIPEFVAADLAAVTLVRVLDAWTPVQSSLSLYYPGCRHLPAGLRALVNLVKEQRAGLRLRTVDKPP